MLSTLTAPNRAVAGQYISNGARWPPSHYARDERRCGELWDEACEMAGIEAHESLR